VLGQAAAALERGPKRWFQQIWGYPYLHTRQDWQALWPSLVGLTQKRLVLLDAGCGPGRWSIELASRRPNWFVVGVDQNVEFLRQAERARRHLGLTNLVFVRAEFTALQTLACFDVVLSVHSAHYLAEAGLGPAEFAAFERCLKPGGRLILYGPRTASEAPWVAWLPKPGWHRVFSSAELRRLCAMNHLIVEQLQGRLGALGAIAKQLDWALSGKARKIALYAGLLWLERLLSALDRLSARSEKESSLYWLLVARATRDADL
jgi:SAM-dependent methyltransferase